MKELRKGKFTEFYWTSPGFDIEEIIDSDYKKHKFFGKSQKSNLLRQLIDNELGLSDRNEKTESRHIAYMKKHDLVDYCDASEKGHLKWYPKGLLIQQLLVKYAQTLAKDWGAFEMKNPFLIRGDQNEVGELMGEFHERDYKIDGGRGIGFLRYASDPLAFPFMQKVKFTERQSPLKVYEEANCFRNELEGEVSGLRRMRWFIMTDMHAACANEDQARDEYKNLTIKFADLMNNIVAKERWVLGWEITKEYFAKEKDWLKSICDESEAPAFFKIMPEMSHYYAFKNEFQSITADGYNVQVSTVQWDIKNGSRFNIGYINSDGVKKPCPVIIHASSIGSVERGLCSILENVALDEKKGNKPTLPYWLSPTQLRIIPVSDRHVEYGMSLLNYFKEKDIRTDIDDRNDTVGKKVSNCGKEWIPYSIVVGDKELDSDKLTLNVRVSDQKKPITKDEIAYKLNKMQDGLPYLPLALNELVSMRPLFK